MTAVCLSEYELQRLANIERNKRTMIELGLEQSKLPSRTTRRSPKRTSTRSRGPRRKSPRLQQNRSIASELPDDLDDDEPDLSPPPTRKRAHRTHADEHRALLTPQQRSLLQGELDLADFENFLRQMHGISPDNCRQVLRQVRKLASGQGVRYESPRYGWPEGVVFMKDEPVMLDTNLEALRDQARDFEDNHGRDRGNGWLLNHPITKLMYYQHHVYHTKFP